MVRRIILITLLLIFPWLVSESSFAFTVRAPVAKKFKPKVVPYCERHARKVISVTDTGFLYQAIQAELNQYNSSEYDHNGRYELCFDLRFYNDPIAANLESDQTLTINNTSPREVVIGFLNATRADGSSAPIIEVKGQRVTLFQLQLSNVKRAIHFEGDRHKLIGGIINGSPSPQPSPIEGEGKECVEGNGNEIEIRNTTINDCVNAVSLKGNDNRVEKTTISFSRLAEMPQLKEGATKQEEEQYLADFEQWLEDNFTATGTCLSLDGQKAVLRDVTVNVCNGTSIKVSGADHSIINTKVMGQPIPENSNLAKHSTHCLLLQNASNVTLEANSFAYCQTGVHVIDSQAIFIGPENIADFNPKKNQLHHNDFAIHVENSEQTFVRHNAVYENGMDSEVWEEFYRFGFWPEDSNNLIAAPVLIPAGNKVEDEHEYPVVHHDDNGEAFVEVNVPVKDGTIELSFSNVNKDEEWKQKKKELYQPHTPFADCSFEDAGEIPASAGMTDLGVGVTGYLVRCPIQVIEEIKGKRLLAILHANPIGSSPFAKALGVINEPTGMPVSGPFPTTGSMTGATTSGGAGTSVGESVGSSSVVGGGGGGVVAKKEGSGSSGGFGFCGLIAEQREIRLNNALGYTLLFIVALIIILSWRIPRHRVK